MTHYEKMKAQLEEQGFKLTEAREETPESHRFGHYTPASTFLTLEADLSDDQPVENHSDTNVIQWRFDAEGKFLQLQLLC